MKKYKVTRRRVVTQQAIFEIEVDTDGGKSPFEVGNSIAVDTWDTVSETTLSTDIEPVVEEVANGAA